MYDPSPLIRNYYYIEQLYVPHLLGIIITSSDAMTSNLVGITITLNDATTPPHIRNYYYIERCCGPTTYQGFYYIERCYGPHHILTIIITSSDAMNLPLIRNYIERYYEPPHLLTARFMLISFE